MNTSDFDPEANPELKDPPDPSEFSIRRNLSELREINYPESPTLH